MRHLAYIFFLWNATLMTFAQIGSWNVYTSFGDVRQVVRTSDGTTFVLSTSGTLFGVDAADEFVDIVAPCYGICGIGYANNTLVVAYTDALIRLLRPDGSLITPITALRDKMMSGDKTITCMSPYGKDIFLGTSFGVLQVDLARAEIIGTYYIDPNGSNVSVHSMSLFADTLAVSTLDGVLLWVCVNDALYDYHVWHIDSSYVGQYVSVVDDTVVADSLLPAPQYDGPFPSGPATNTAYRIRCVGSQTYIVPGGYFATSSNIPANLSRFEARTGRWWNYTSADFRQWLGAFPRDLCDVCVVDADHFFVSSFGYGLFEFRHDAPVAHYMPSNSGLEIVANFEWGYTWVDGLAYDRRNEMLWMSNISAHSLKALRSDGSWRWVVNDATQALNRCQDVLLWSRDPDVKVFSSCRVNAGIGVFDSSDSTNAFHHTFVDQDDKEVAPSFIYSLSQDHRGVLWIGTNAGPLIVPTASTLFLSNRCERLKVSRDDGSGLADYLLGSEQIHAIAVDGANNKWLGTTTSGVFCVDDHGQTLAHFTTENSPLPSNDILAIDISPYNGAVWIGTTAGIVTYMGAALEGTDGGALRVWPNPVRPDYEGPVVIDGTLSDEEVYIVNSAGEVVFRTRSNGGRAQWSTPHTVPTGAYMVVSKKARGRVVVM